MLANRRDEADAVALVLEDAEVSPAAVLALVLLGWRSARHYELGRVESGRIFVGARDSYDRGRDAAEAAGVEKPTLHACRHGYASLMIASGVNIKAISVFMGHANIRITLDQYGHLLPGAEDEAAGLLDAFLARQVGSDDLEPSPAPELQLR